MNIIKSVFILLFIFLSNTAFAGEVVCRNAIVDTIAVEGDRPDAPLLSNSLVISFKDSNGNHDNCGGVIDRYVYLKIDSNSAVYDAMLSIAFMARANNYKVNYTVITGNRIYSADKLSVIQIVDNTAIPQLLNPNITN